MSRPNWVYIMTNKRNGTLYLGSTSNLELRVGQHRAGTGSTFTKKYDLTRLVWYEEYPDYESAINNEHRMKKWRRQWKINLIEERNPNWGDLWVEIARW
jgi:putative endonuclease